MYQLSVMPEKEIKIVRYEPGYREVWNNFNRKAVNGLFLFDRDYMEYHHDRFRDYSLLIFEQKHLLAIFPLNAASSTVYSHAGLTYGGIIISGRVKIHLYLRLFEAVINYLRQKGFAKLLYKTLPYIFHQSPTQEDQYALFLYRANLVSRKVYSCLYLQAETHYTKGRKWSLKKALQANLELKESTDFNSFLQILETLLHDKYAAKPTHTAAEINYLALKFPDNIKLFVVYHQQKMIGGSIVYISRQVVHFQYIAITETGKKLHALDYIVHFLVQKYKATKKYLNFSSSVGDDIFGFNMGLIQNKESYGARSLTQDIYELTL